MAMTGFRKPGEPTRKAKPPSVSLNPQGLIEFNSALRREIGEDWNFAVLGFDDETREIGIRLLRSGSVEDAYRIHRIRLRGGHRGPGTIMASAFFSWAGIEVSERMRLATRFDPAERMIFASLGEKASPSG